MVLDAVRDARATWPDAEIDLAVGSWNAPLAEALADVTHVDTVDVPWLARAQGGLSWPALVKHARSWRARQYDVVINFEPDIRSNFLAWLSGAPRRIGYSTGGGAALLTDATAYEPTSHVSVNARRLVARAAGKDNSSESSPASWAAELQLTEIAKTRARDLLRDAHRPLIGMHVSGGRESKQWHLDRFAEVARRLARDRQATLLLTGSADDRAMIDRVKKSLDDVRVIDVSGALDVPELAVVLAGLDLLVTSDTGPMHLASAVSTPVVALFGPSDPRRYGPLAEQQRIVRVNLWCSPCGRVRLPPERCRGHVPDCMDGITVDAVVEAALDLLDHAQPRPHHAS